MSKSPKKHDIEGVFTVSGLQKSMLYQCRSEPGQGHYIEQIVLQFAKLDIPAMEKALNQLVSRYRALRSFFVWREQEEPRQVTLRSLKIAIKQSKETSLDQLLEKDRKTDFTLTSAPLMRVTVAVNSKGNTYCLWSLHHAVVDGWSMATLQNSLLVLYRSIILQLPVPETGIGPDWPKSKKNDSKQWQKLLNNPPDNRLLNSLPAPSDQKKSQAEISQSLDQNITMEIERWCQNQKVTFASFSYVSWSLIIAYISGQKDLVFGSVDHGRLHQQISDTAIGMFMQLRPVRLILNESESISDLVIRFQREQWLLGSVVPPDLTNLAQQLQRSPQEHLFESVVLVQNYPKADSYEDIGLQKVSGYEQSEVPLTVSIAKDENIQILMRYKSDTINPCTVRKILECFKQLMVCITSLPKDTATAQILYQVSQSVSVSLDNRDVGHRPERCITRFAQQVTQQPNAPALIDQRIVTFKELSHIAESVRQQLVQCDVQAGDVVGICLPRSVQAVSAMLAVQALDACFLTLDPNYPNQRLEYMIKDSGTVLTLTDSDATAAKNYLKLNFDAADTPLSYSKSMSHPSMCLVYTSGSTGNPKGVKLQHIAVSNRISWMENHFHWADQDICCLRTPLSFVDSVCEIFGPLTAGVPAVIIPDNLLAQLNRFIDALNTHRISRLTLVPTLLNAILDSLIESDLTLPSLKLCIVSGEALPGVLADKFYRQMPHCQLLNLYGSTEVTADALFYQVTPHNIQQLVPIGGPISGMSAFVTNAWGHHLPDYIIGELAVSGIGVAEGYHGKRELTGESFNDNTYFTGDLAYIGDHALAHFKGRKDRQIKVRGQRVEPAAIENLLLEIHGINRAVVFNKNQHLVAVYTGEVKESVELRATLSKKLPLFSVPERFVYTSDIPELPNGKVDHAALNDLILTPSEHSRTEPMLSMYEHQLASTIGNIWQDLLPDETITENSHFFESGGHSLLAMKMIARTERALGISINLILLIHNPILADFTHAVINTSSKSLQKEMITLRRGTDAKARAVFCIHGDAYNLVRHIPTENSIYWISQWARRMELTKNPSAIQPESIQQLSTRYAKYIQEVQPKQGFDLIGSCGAGVVALEVAHILSKQGQAPSKLILMDLPRGELKAPLQRRYTQRQNVNWLHSLYYYLFRVSGGERMSLRLAYWSMEKKIRKGVPLTDTEARNYTDAQLYSALEKYAPSPYNGSVELVFSGRWRRGFDSPEDASVPSFWRSYLTNVKGFHFSPVRDHRDLLEGDGAAFAADVLGLNPDH